MPRPKKKTSSPPAPTFLLQADQAYFAVLKAQAVLTVAQQTVHQRQLVADQISTLAQNKIKSGLDVSFANVDLAQAQLLLIQAQNDLQASFAQLSAALGYSDERTFNLTDEPLPPLPLRTSPPSSSKPCATARNSSASASTRIPPTAMLRQSVISGFQRFPRLASLDLSPITRLRSNPPPTTPRRDSTSTSRFSTATCSERFAPKPTSKRAPKTSFFATSRTESSAMFARPGSTPIRRSSAFPSATSS